MLQSRHPSPSPCARLTTFLLPSIASLSPSLSHGRGAAPPRASPPARSPGRSLPPRSPSLAAPHARARRAWPRSSPALVVPRMAGLQLARAAMAGARGRPSAARGWAAARPPPWPGIELAPAPPWTGPRVPGLQLAHDHGRGSSSPPPRAGPRRVTGRSERLGAASPDEARRAWPCCSSPAPPWPELSCVASQGRGRAGTEGAGDWARHPGRARSKTRAESRGRAGP
jgi:hypothetical protein